VRISLFGSDSAWILPSDHESGRLTRSPPFLVPPGMDNRTCIREDRDLHSFFRILDDGARFLCGNLYAQQPAVRIYLPIRPTRTGAF